MNEPEGFTHALIILLQIGNHPKYNYFVQDKKDEPADSKEVIICSAINRGNGFRQEEEVDINGDERHQENSNNQLRALVFAARDFFFKLRVNNGRRSLQMKRGYTCVIDEFPPILVYIKIR